MGHIFHYSVISLYAEPVTDFSIQLLDIRPHFNKFIMFCQ